MKKLALIFIISLIGINCHSQANFPDRQKFINLKLDSLLGLLCEDVKNSISHISFKEFSDGKLDKNSFTDSCKNNLSEFYLQTNSVSRPDLKYELYNDVFPLRGIAPDIYVYIIDEKFRLAIYEKLTNQKLSIFSPLSWDWSIDKFNDIINLINLRKEEKFIENRYIPETIDEAIQLATKTLDSNDIKRINAYQTDEDCFWGELDLSAQKIIDEWFLFAATRLSEYIYKNTYPTEMRYDRQNGYFLAGLIIVAIRNNDNPKFEIKQFVKDFKFLIPLNNYTKPKRGEKHVFSVD